MESDLKLFFDELLVRDKVISESTFINDVVCDLYINEYKLPTLVGSFSLNGKFYTREYTHHDSEWKLSTIDGKDVFVEVPNNKTLTSETSEEDTPLEVKAWFRRLPANPDLIPKGQQREWLREIPIEMLHKKYNPKEHPVLYKWLSIPTKKDNE